MRSLQFSTFYVILMYVESKYKTLVGNIALLSKTIFYVLPASYENAYKCFEFFIKK